MPASAAHAAAFYSEVARNLSLWTIRDAGGYPAPKNHDGARSQPFWSSQSRATRIVSDVPAYAGFDVIEIAWDVFRTRWAPGLSGDAVLVGVNWSGPSATGYDVPADDVVRNVEALLGG